MLNISNTFVLTSKTTDKNFDNKSMSFYTNLDDMFFLYGVKNLVLVHESESGQKRTIVVDGTKFYNSLQRRSHRGKQYAIYRY